MNVTTINASFTVVAVVLLCAGVGCDNTFGWVLLPTLNSSFGPVQSQGQPAAGPPVHACRLQVACFKLWSAQL